MCRVCPRPLKTHFYSKPAVPVASVAPSDLRAHLETTLRRPPKIEKNENSQTFFGRNTSSVWVPTIPEPHRDLPRSSHVVWRPGEGFGPIWGVSSVDEDTLRRSRSSSTPRMTFSRPGPSSRTALRRATATWGPRRRRGDIWAAPTTAALTTSPSPIRAQLRRPSAMPHTQPSPRSRAGPNIDVKAPPWTRDGPRTTPTQPRWFHPGSLPMGFS